MDKKYLIGTSGAYAGQEIPIEDEIVIGRDSSVCQLVYEASEKMISGVHCKVKNIDGVIQLMDMGSTNGTCMDNGVRLNPYEPQTLEGGQGFYLGDKMNSFVISNDENEKPRKQSFGLIQNETTNTKAHNAIGISITSLALGILAIVTAISYLFISFAIYPAIVFAVVGLALGAISLFLHFQGKFMALIGTIVSGIVIFVLIAGIIKQTATASVVGTWTCDDVNLVKNALRNTIETGLTEAGLDGRIADSILDFTGMGDDVIFTFSETGNLYIGNENGVDITLGIIKWEDTGDDHIRFIISLKELEIFGNKLPIEVGYRAAYTVKGKNMTLDFFGQNVVFKRK